MACRIYGQKFKLSTRCSNPAFPLASIFHRVAEVGGAVVLGAAQA